MSRFSYLLEKKFELTESKIIGVFPFNALIDPRVTDVHNGRIEFLDSAMQGLKFLSEKKYSIVLFINQFKRQLPMEHFQSLNGAVDKFIKGTGVNILNIYWCPSIDKNDPFVVPNSGMFNRATENQGIQWEGIPVISSFDNDLMAASKVKAIPVKIGNGSDKWTHFNSFLDWTSSIK